MLVEHAAVSNSLYLLYNSTMLNSQIFAIITEKKKSLLLRTNLLGNLKSDSDPVILKI